MLKIKNILIPFDFSTCSFQALNHAIFLAKRYNSTLHILHAIPQKSVVNTFSPEVSASICTSSLLEQAQKEISTIVESHNTKHLTIKIVPVLTTSPTTTTLDYASVSKIDLIVIGTHGRRGLERLLLGSTTEDIVRLANCPVLTIKESPEPVVAKVLDEILVPVDFSQESLLALSYAISMAKLYGSKIRVLHVAEKPIYPLLTISQTNTEAFPFDVRINSKLKMKQWVSSLTDLDVVAEIEVLEGKPSTLIVEYAKEHNIDRIVMGTKGLDGAKHLLGCVAKQVIRRAKCPIFFVKHMARQIPTIIDQRNQYSYTQKNTDPVVMDGWATHQIPLAS